MSKFSESFLQELAAAPKADQAKALKLVVDSLSSDQKIEVAQALGMQLPPPDPNTSSKVWLIIIWAFVLAMLTAVVVLGINVFLPSGNGGTTPETMVTIFTTVTAFLAGLFAPSPVAKK
jgi:hypothetical protein